MSRVTLQASTDREAGSRASRRLRRAGDIPGIVYGAGVSALAVAVDARAFRQAVSGERGLNTLIELSADGRSFVVMAREVQRHPVRGTVAHIDFQVVDPDAPVVVEVPLHLVGDAVEVRHADWEVDQQIFAIELRTRPERIPTHVDVDVSALRAGASIRLGDVVLPEGVDAMGDPNVTVVATHAGRATKTGAPA